MRIDQEETNKRIKPFFVACYLVLLKQRQVLLLRRYNTGYEDGKYSLIAGHVEPDETVLDALIRESREEVGIEVNRGDLEFLSVVHRKYPDTRIYLDLFFTCRRWIGEPSNIEPSKCDQLRWADLDDLPDNIIDYVRRALRGLTEDSPRYSEIGW
jgi:8-oxo-dGTP diphosphatase